MYGRRGIQSIYYMSAHGRNRTSNRAMAHVLQVVDQGLFQQLQVSGRRGGDGVFCTHDVVVHHGCALWETSLMKGAASPDVGDVSPL